MQLQQIGKLHSDLKFKSEAPTQGVYAGEPVAEIHLEAGFNFEQALIGLEEFDRIWLIYSFHQNQDWKPMVNVPRLPDEKKGVFATRSPYRPNPLGLSCVRLLEVRGRILSVCECDLLDGTPIYDIKPYINYADRFDAKQAAWLEQAESQEYQIVIPEYMAKKIDFAAKIANLNFRQFIQSNLRFEPLRADRKRVEVLRTEDSGEILGRIAYRTWRLQFSVNEEQRKIFVLDLFSGYSKEELSNLDNDPYGDKKIHQRFIAKSL